MLGSSSVSSSRAGVCRWRHTLPVLSWAVCHFSSLWLLWWVCTCEVEPSENQANGGHERRQKWCQCRKYGVWSQPPQSQSLTCPETGESYAYGFGAQHLQCSSKDGPGSQPFSLRSTKIEEAIRGGKNTNSSLITLCLLYL